MISYKGARIINFYGELFGIDYALPKMDMCVQPSMGGAMENWGLGNLTSFYLLRTCFALTGIATPSRVYLIDTGNKGRARDSRTP
jgi:hypothetical protein